MLSLPAAALALGMSPARLRWLCAQGRVPGAERSTRYYAKRKSGFTSGRGWLIPETLTRDQIVLFRPGRKKGV